MPPMPLQDREDPKPDVSHVRIVNNNEFAIADRFNGEIFTFKPKDKVTIPYGAAQHIFGLGMDQDEQLFHCSRRFGWNMAGGELAARERFDNISISPVFMKLVEVTPDLDYPDPLAGKERKMLRGNRYKGPTDDLPEAG